MPSRIDRTTRRRAVAAAALLLVGVTGVRAQDAAPAAVPELRRELAITIVALDGASPGRRLRPAPAAGAEDAPAPRSGGWRHTFGAERRTPPAAAPRPAVRDADIVLVIGVTSPSAVRQLYPARTHALTVSRALLGDGGADAPTTAVAISREAGLRATAAEHFTASAAEGQRRTLERGLMALRLGHPAGPLWVVTADAGSICAGAGAGCTAEASAAQLAQWVQARHAAGESVVISGRLGAVKGEAFKTSLMRQLATAGASSSALPPAAACKGSAAADTVLAISAVWKVTSPKAMPEACGAELVLAPK